MTEKLLPCPFCGGEADFERLGDRRQSCIIECESCGCQLETGEEGELCGSQWNQRAAQPSVPWENFPGYLIDHCEGEIITEEGLQCALSAMLQNPQYLSKDA